MMLNKKLTRPGVLLIAGVVAVLTFAVVAHAVQTVTVANASLISYNLAPAGNLVVTVPVVDQPVLVMGCTTTVGTRGVGHVSLLRVSAAPTFLEWVGLESTAGAAIAQGFSATLGTHIVFLDFAHQVDLEVNTATSFRVHNGAAAARAGTVKMIW